MLSIARGSLMLSDLIVIIVTLLFFSLPRRLSARSASLQRHLARTGAFGFQFEAGYSDVVLTLSRIVV